MITVIAPHARPEFSENLLVNFRRQRGVEARLLVVVNGAADGEDHITVPPRCTVINAPAHQASAMNAGLDWLRANGGGSWARFDDDDYYGPDYLAGVERSFDQRQELDGGGLVVSGFPWRFVMFDEGLYQFHGQGDFTGGSLAASSADVAAFPRRQDDDIQWCRDMRERGALFIEREPHGYCYDRRTRSAPRVILGGSAVSRFAFGAGDFYGTVPVEAVDWPGLVPLRHASAPSDEELMAEMSAC